MEYFILGFFCAWVIAGVGYVAIRGQRKTPLLLMQEGNIKPKALQQAHLRVDDLMAAARSAGYFNLADVDCAMREADGSISFLPQPMKRPLNPKDFNFAPVREGLCTTVIADGRVLYENLPKAQFSDKKLLEFLASRGYTPEKILIATINEAGRVDVFEK